VLEPERVSLKRLQRYGVFVKKTKYFRMSIRALTRVRCEAVRQCRLVRQVGSILLRIIL
jgi:hypothetical protein